MRGESTARPAPRLKSSGPDMKESFPVHERTAYSLGLIWRVLGARSIAALMEVRGWYNPRRRHSALARKFDRLCAEAGKASTSRPRPEAKLVESQALECPPNQGNPTPRRAGQPV